MPTKTDNPEVTLVTTNDPAKIGLEKTDECYLVLIYGEPLGRKSVIKAGTFLIGRAPDCDIQLADDCLSRVHCRIVSNSDGVVIADLDSTNGTYVNNAAVSVHPLKDGDRVKVGRTIFSFLSSDNIEHAYHEEIYRLKTTDGLTGAFNKRYFEEEAERELFRFFRYARPLSLVFFDLDHFKELNDTHGHLAGDRVLSQFSSLILASIRREDTFCRYGGEEFALLMPEMSGSEAVREAEKLRKLVEQARFAFEGVALSVTVSAGVVEADEKMTSIDDFVKRADVRLYEAKQGGRNQIRPTPERPVS